MRTTTVFDDDMPDCLEMNTNNALRLSGIHAAAALGDNTLVRKIVSKFKDAFDFCAPCNGASPMHIAAQCGKVSTIELLVELKADIHVTTYDGASALYVAALENSFESTRMLLKLGSRINQHTHMGFGPIDVAGDGTSVKQCLEDWQGMNHSQRNVLRRIGWRHYELPRWQPSRHHSFPMNLRTQIVALAISLDAIPRINSILHMITSGMDDAQRKLGMFENAQDVELIPQQEEQDDMKDFIRRLQPAASIKVSDPTRKTQCQQDIVNIASHRYCMYSDGPCFEQQACG